jgi:hypothetical protein
VYGGEFPPLPSMSSKNTIELVIGIDIGIVHDPGTPLLFKGFPIYTVNKVPFALRPALKVHVEGQILPLADGGEKAWRRRPEIHFPENKVVG